MKYDLKGHPRSYNKATFMPIISSTFLTYLMKICMNANIMKTQFFH